MVPIGSTAVRSALQNTHHDFAEIAGDHGTQLLECELIDVDTAFVEKRLQLLLHRVSRETGQFYDLIEEALAAFRSRAFPAFLTCQCRDPVC